MAGQEEVTRVVAEISIDVGGGWCEAGGCKDFPVPFPEKLVSATLELFEGLEPPPAGRTEVYVDGEKVGEVWEGEPPEVAADITLYAMDGKIRVCVKKITVLPMYWVGGFTARGRLILEYVGLAEDERRTVLEVLAPEKKEVGWEDVVRWTLIATGIGVAAFGLAELVKAFRSRR